jgi:2,5-diamino-6-(ribosylamino)-4(3H)-pyrimidinone 5'-phosphate reductase
MKKPYVLINCAMSIDGKISLPSKKQMKISGKKDLKRMFELRNQSDGILVGINTVLSDNPKLTIKKEYVKNIKQPVRIILDSNCKTPENSYVVDNKAKTWIVTSKKSRNIYGKNVEIIISKKNKNGLIDLQYLLNSLYQRGIKKLMVEGGGTVIWNFLKEKLVDDLYIYVSPIIIGGKNTPTVVDGSGIKNQNEKILLKLIKISELGSGTLFHYRMIK